MLITSEKTCLKFNFVINKKIKTKEETTNIIKECYDNEEFELTDVVGISKGTTKQDELFDYVDAPYYYKERVKDYDEYNYDKDDFDLGR